MSWNLRVMRHKDPLEDYFAIHEVFYDQDGRPRRWSQNPVSLTNESVEGLKNYVTMISRAFEEPVLDYA